MTEQEWLVSDDDPARMLRFVAGEYGQLGIRPETYSARKVRLFACACCRQVWELLKDRRSRQAIEVSEQYADGAVSASACLRACHEAQETDHSFHPGGLHDEATAASWAADINPQEAAEGVLRYLKSDNSQSALLRDLFGNPYRPRRCLFGHTYAECGIVPCTVTNSCRDCNRVLTWNDRTVPRMAEAIYQERRFEDMPQLADALSDAGCENEEILMHCRGFDPCPDQFGMHSVGMDTCCFCNGTNWRRMKTPHVRGCWVLDLLLGKS